MRNPVAWRWSHARHHTDTYIVGRDPEIAFMRPPACQARPRLFRRRRSGSPWDPAAAGRGKLSDDEKDYIPEGERRRRSWRAHLIAIYAATIVAALGVPSSMPLMLIGLPRIYGAWHMVMCGLLQHGGLADNVPTTG